MYSRQPHPVRAPLFSIKLKKKKKKRIYISKEFGQYDIIFPFTKIYNVCQHIKKSESPAVKISAQLYLTQSFPNSFTCNLLFHNTCDHLMQPVLCKHTLRRLEYRSGVQGERAQSEYIFSGMPTCSGLHGDLPKMFLLEPQNVTKGLCR